MKKIVGFIALCALVVIGAKFYLEYQYKKELDQVIAGVGPVAEITYKSLNVGFDGTIKLNDLSITANDTFDTFKTDAVQLKAWDFLSLFTLKSKIQKGELPKTVDVEIDQLSFPTSMHERRSQVEKDECRNLNGTVRYSAAGFDDVVVDSKMSFDMTDPFNATLDIINVDQISRGKFNMNFNAREMFSSSVISGSLPIETMSYSYFLDEEAATTMVNYCAKKFDLTPEVFLEQIVKSKKFMANSFDMQLGDAVSNAMASFLQGGKEISVVSTPSKRLQALNFVSTPSVPQIIRMLNMKVSLDGDSVPIRTFQSASSGSSDESSEGDETAGEPEGFKRRDLDALLNDPDGTVQERNRPTLAKKRKNQYERATLSRATSYIDKDIRVTRTKDRKPVLGRLLSVEDQTLSVETFRYGGVVTFTVPYKDIAKLEVKKKR